MDETAFHIENKMSTFITSTHSHSKIFSECQRASGRRMWGKGKVNKEK